MIDRDRRATFAMTPESRQFRFPLFAIIIKRRFAPFRAPNRGPPGLSSSTNIIKLWTMGLGRKVRWYVSNSEQCFKNLEIRFCHKYPTDLAVAGTDHHRLSRNNVPFDD